MRIGEIGGRHFAMELAWTAIAGEKPAAVAKEVAAELGKTYYTALKNADGELVCGTGQLELGERAPRRPLYSFVSALCMLERDAIYVGHVDDQDGAPCLWYAVIHGGCVSPGTDISRPASEVVNVVNGLSATLGIPIMVMGEVNGLEAASSFDPVDLIARAKPQVLKTATAGAPKAKILAAAAVLVIGTVAGHSEYTKYKASQAIKAAADAEAQATAAYVSQIRLIAEQLPTSSSWSTQALSQGLSRLPAWYAGWELQHFTCNPRRCEGEYKPSQDGFNYQALLSRFGAAKANWREQDRLMTVLLDLQAPASFRVWNDGELLQPVAANLPSVAVVGLLPGKIPNIAAKETSLNLSSQFAAPGTAAQLWQDDITTEASFYLDGGTLRTLSTVMGGAGFVARELRITRGAENALPTWKVTWTRLRGETTGE
jgi:hypothetical protein